MKKRRFLPLVIYFNLGTLNVSKFDKSWKVIFLSLYCLRAVPSKANDIPLQKMTYSAIHKNGKHPNY